MNYNDFSTESASGRLENTVKFRYSITDINFSSRSSIICKDHMRE